MAIIVTLTYYPKVGVKMKIENLILMGNLKS
jgi:hypothetical protein